MSFTRQRDVNKSFYEAVKLRFELGVNIGHVIYNDRLADPSGMNAGNTPLAWWVELRILNGGARQGRPTLIQVDVTYEVGTEADEATRDRYGHVAEEKADDFLEAVFTPNDSGLMLYDFTIPAAPVPIRTCLFAITPNGRYGEPSERRQIDELSRGLIRVVMTIPLWLNEDQYGMTTYR